MNLFEGVQTGRSLDQRAEARKAGERPAKHSVPPGPLAEQATFHLCASQ